MTLTQDLWEKAVAFHGHACPGLAVGFRMSCMAAEFLGIKERSHDEELFCITETDSCAVDAVQMVLGCSLGKGNLILKLRGKDAMTFAYRPSGRACRIIWRKDYSTLPGEPDKLLSFILSNAGSAACALEEVPLPVLPAAFTTASYTCDSCNEPTAEPMLLFINKKKYCRDCAPRVSRIIF